MPKNKEAKGGQYHYNFFSHISMATAEGLSSTQKRNELRKIVKSLKLVDTDSLSFKGKIYWQLLRAGAIDGVLALEFLRKKGARKLIPSGIINKISYILSRGSLYDSLEKDEKKVVIALAGDYGNLGDSAITEAQSIFLTKTFPDYKIIELPATSFYNNLKTLRKKVNEEDIITIVGGGNTGSLYASLESQRRIIIKTFHHNPIIAFPQSIYYGKTFIDKRSLKRAQRIFGTHPRLTLFARDKKSFILMKQYFNKNNVYLAPDIVLSLDRSNTVKRKEKLVTIALRHDKESNLRASEREKLIHSLGEQGYTVRQHDTDLGDVRLNNQRRKQELANIWNRFMESQLVITDRLHGMIFCVITKTPCVAIDNNNGKVRALYDCWLRDVNFIKFAELDTASVYKSMQHLSNVRPRTRLASLRSELSKMQRIIMRAVKDE